MSLGAADKESADSLGQGGASGSSHAATLVLDDGTVVFGQGFGARGTVFGELVFNTGMTGYQEALTDPSYHGQILMFTYPIIGNYGVNAEDNESARVWPRGVVVREHCLTPSHRSSTKTVHDFLVENGIPGISGIDTRALTIKTRARGCLRGFLSNENLGPRDLEDLKEKAANGRWPSADNLVADVSVKEPVLHLRNEGGKFGAPTGASFRTFAQKVAALEDPAVVLVDTGVKWNIVRNLVQNFNVVQVPWDLPADKVRALAPKGLFYSNGPGDPAHPAMLKNTVATMRSLHKDYPLMGICLGHQLLGLALGGKTFKLKYGHRGGNQPVQDLETGRVYITSQNHGYAVDSDSLTKEGIVLTQVNLNDRTCEGLRSKDLPLWSVQYHPEACPGPRDTTFLFDGYRRKLEALHV